MSRYSRVGRPRPGASGLELAVWYLMRLSGLALFVLAMAHFLIMHVVFDPDLQTAEWIAANRWNSIFWRSFDWLLLMTVLFHSFFGVRTVVGDYVKGGAKTAVMMAIYALAAIIFVIGTIVVMTMPLSGGAG
jgi:succinate dehydrogenase / fumarate reductase membrane anchor subunit